MQPVPIVVLAYNKAALTEACIDSIHTHTTVPFEIILVDNGSEQPFPESDRYTLVRLPQNLYYTRGINAGIRYARQHLPAFKHIVLLNNDIVVNSGWLSSMASNSTPEVGIIGNKQFLMDEPDTVIHAGTADLIGGNHKGGPDDGMFDQQTEEVWVTFACVLIKRPCLDAIGLLDERMVHFYSDNDLCLRAWMAGFKVIYEPNSTIQHKHHASYREASVDFSEDEIVYMNKWMGRDLVEKIFNRIFLNSDTREMLTLQRNIISSKKSSG